MKATTFDAAARKRPVNPTFNEDLVAQGRGLTNNLSGAVESLVADYVEHQRQQRIATARTLEATMSMRNGFNAGHGSFVDDYSSL
jgi:antitoxin CcdA